MEKKLNELGFVLHEKSHAYQQYLDIPTYYNKELNIYLMQYDAVSHEDLRDKDVYCALAIYKDCKKKMWISKEIIEDVEYMKKELLQLHNSVKSFYKDKLK